MKKAKIAALFLCALALSSHAAHTKGDIMKQEITRKGALGGFKGDSKIFSGEVRVEMMFHANKWRSFSGGAVHFAPKARSAWHTHPAGQTLIVTEGSIYTGTREGVIDIARAGDVISCPPDVEHWHGAGAESSGTHIALTLEKDGINVLWGEKVSDEEYERAIQQAKSK